MGRGAGYNPGYQQQQRYSSAQDIDNYGYDQDNERRYHEADGREQGAVKQYFEYSRCEWVGFAITCRCARTLVQNYLRSEGRGVQADVKKLEWGLQEGVGR